MGFNGCCWDFVGFFLSGCYLTWVGVAMASSKRPLSLWLWRIRAELKPLPFHSMNRSVSFLFLFTFSFVSFFSSSHGRNFLWERRRIAPSSIISRLHPRRRLGSIWLDDISIQSFFLFFYPLLPSFFFLPGSIGFALRFATEFFTELWAIELYSQGYSHRTWWNQVLLGFFFYRILIQFYCVSLGHTELYEVASSFYRTRTLFDLFRPNYIKMDLIVLSSTMFDRVLPSFTEYFWIDLVLT